MTQRKNKDPKRSSIHSYAKYSGLAFEMLGIIFLGAFVGTKLDDNRAGEFPIWTVCLSLFAVFTSLYLVIKSLLRK